MNHARTARGQDQVDERMLHQPLGEFQSGLADAADQSRRRPGRHRGIVDDLGRRGRAARGMRMRGKDDGVARF